MIISCQNSKIDWFGYYSKLEKGETVTIIQLSERCQSEITGLNAIHYQKLINAEIAIYNLQYSKAEDQLAHLTSAESSITINRRAQLNLLKIFSIDNKELEWQNKQYSALENIDWSKLSNIDLYHYIQLLYYKTSSLRHASHLSEALANVDYALHQMTKHNLTQDFPRLHAKLLGTKAAIFISESFGYNEPAKELLLKSSNIATKIGDEELFRKQMLNLANCYLQLKDTVSSTLIINDLSQKIDEASPYSRFYFYTNQGFLHLQKSNAAPAIYSFKKSLKIFQDSKCSRYKQLLNLYIADAYLEGENIDSSEYYLGVTLDMIKCNDNEKDQIKSYAQYTINEIYQYKYKINQNLSYIDSALQSIIEERRLSLKLYGDRNSLHLDEYYSENLAKFLSVLHPYPSLYPKYSSKVINLYEDTKKRQLSLEKIKGLNKNTITDKLESLLRKADDHKKNDDFSDPIYEKIYSLYNQPKNSQPANPFIKIKPISIVDLKGEIKKSNTQIINCIDYNGISWCYNLSEDYFTIDSITISSKDALPDFGECEYYNKITFLGDGSTEGKSIELILPNSEIEYAYSLNQYLSNRKIYLSNSDITILSYTNEASHKSLSSKSYTELYNGYQECKSIHALFPESAFHSGTENNKKKFASIMQSDILHISTHAYSDSLKRLESYLILRDSLGEPTRLYANEILSMPTVPKFVNLSACQTGTGVHMAGAGTYSIARSFLQKGSEAVMKTLWDVDDRATKEFMIQFYTYWKEGMSCGDALYKTKEDFKSSNEYSDPMYWAGFILEGNPNLYLVD